MMKWMLCLLSGLLLSQCTSSPVTEKQMELPYYKTADFTPYWKSKMDAGALKDWHKVPDFSLTNQLNETITRDTFAGKIYVADFFFTICPGICPKLTNNMLTLQDTFAQDDEVLLLSHSVTPEIDSVPKLQAYAESKGISSGKWHLVTGDREEIYRLGRHAYFIEEDLGVMKDPDEFLHTENFVLIDQEGHLRGLYNGLSPVDVQHLINDIRILKRQ